MVYYLIKNEDGFEELVFQGSREDAESRKILLESNLSRGDERLSWTRVKYYIFRETEWTTEIGTMH